MVDVVEGARFRRVRIHKLFLNYFLFFLLARNTTQAMLTEKTSGYDALARLEYVKHAPITNHWSV